MRPCCFAASRTACIVSLFCEANCSNPFGFPAVTSNAMITDIAGLLSRQPTLLTCSTPGGFLQSAACLCPRPGQPCRLPTKVRHPFRAREQDWRGEPRAAVVGVFGRSGKAAPGELLLGWT